MTAAHVMHSHGDVLANIPATLGYFPADSLILAFYVSDRDHNDTAGDNIAITLGPVARIDLADALDQITDNALDFMMLTYQHNLVAVAAYVIGTGNAALQQAEAITDELHDNPLFPPLLSVVVTDEISTDAVYQAVYTHPMISSGAAQGTISNVATSATMRDMIDRSGAVPDVSRDDVAARLTSTAHSIDAEAYPELLFDVASFNARSASITALQRIYETATRGIIDPADIAALRAGLQCFTTPALRDPLLAALMEEDPQRSLTFAEALMRAVPQEWTSIRAQATATVAICAYSAGLAGFAHSAARHAVDLAPDNSYANLILGLFDVGRPKDLLHSARQGGSLARTALFEGDIAV